MKSERIVALLKDFNTVALSLILVASILGLAGLAYQNFSGSGHGGDRLSGIEVSARSIDEVLTLGELEWASPEGRYLTSTLESQRCPPGADESCRRVRNLLVITTLGERKTWLFGDNDQIVTGVFPLCPTEELCAAPGEFAILVRYHAPDDPAHPRYRLSMPFGERQVRVLADGQKLLGHARVGEVLMITFEEGGERYIQNLHLGDFRALPPKRLPRVGE